MATAALPPVVATPVAAVTTPATRARPRAVAAWLLAVAALVFAMVVVGGITRLTESGLSIVRWNPVGGMVPPLSAAEWVRVFADYRASPQGRLVNAGIDLAAFKGIFFWEWLHRLLGMSIGTVFAVPLAAFALLRWVPRGYGWRLAALLALGGLQGAIGWWMVASGLVDRPAVAPARLAIHLVNALVLMSGCLWTALDLLAFPSPSGEGRETAKPARGWGGDTNRGVSPGPYPRAALRAALAPPLKGRGRWIVPFLTLLAVQIVWGALTAGLRAGHAADTWPLMGSVLVPPLGSLVADPVSVQFVHRALAWAVAAAALAVAVVTFRAGAGRRAVALAGLIVAQFALGVLTVVNDVPIPLAAAHQACAALLLAATVWLAHWAVRPSASVAVS